MGTFENFLPALFDQREDPDALRYSRDMDPKRSKAEGQMGFDPALFAARVEGYRAADNQFVYQQFARTSFL